MTALHPLQKLLLLAVASTRRSKVLVSKAVHPESRAILTTVAKGQGYGVEEVSLASDVTDLRTT